MGCKLWVGFQGVRMGCESFHEAWDAIWRVSVPVIEYRIGHIKSGAGSLHRYILIITTPM